MSENTKIEWADATWNPWRGCTKVSAGCANCYAETLSRRNPAVLGQWGKGKPRVLAKNWGDPVKWNREATSHWPPVQFIRPRVFPSLCDWLDDEVPIEWLARFLKLIHDTPNLNWLLLTKRPELFHKRLALAVEVKTDGTGRDGDFWQWLVNWWAGTAPRNVWIGASVEDQPNADRRIPALLKIPAKLRFLSVEPMLGPVDLSKWIYDRRAEIRAAMFGPAALNRDQAESVIPECPIGWVIVGGESGPGSRPCDIDWVRSVARQCAAVEKACFVKQLGARPVGRWTASPDKAGLGEGWPAGLKIAHPKGGDPAEWPEDLRVRQMPEVKP